MTQMRYLTDPLCSSPQLASILSRQKSPGSAQHTCSTTLELCDKGIQAIAWAAEPTHMLAAACGDYSIRVRTRVCWTCLLTSIGL